MYNVKVFCGDESNKEINKVREVFRKCEGNILKMSDMIYEVSSDRGVMYCVWEEYTNEFYYVDTLNCETHCMNYKEFMAEVLCIV